MLEQATGPEKEAKDAADAVAQLIGSARAVVDAVSRIQFPLEMDLTPPQRFSDGLEGLVKALGDFVASRKRCEEIHLSSYYQREVHKAAKEATQALEGDGIDFTVLGLALLAQEEHFEGFVSLVVASEELRQYKQDGKTGAAGGPGQGVGGGREDPEVLRQWIKDSPIREWILNLIPAGTSQRWEQIESKWTGSDAHLSRQLKELAERGLLERPMKGVYRRAAWSNSVWPPPGI